MRKTMVIAFAGMFVSALGSALAGWDDGGAMATAAFERLKGLEGVWEADLGGGDKARSRIEVIAGGSAIVDRYQDTKLGRGKEMVTVYHLDGDRLLLTHYCVAGNQPRMKLESFDPTTGELRFEFLDATGLRRPGAGHMHRALYRLEDSRHFSTVWDWVEKSKTTSQEAEHYTRVSP